MSKKIFIYIALALLSAISIFLFTQKSKTLKNDTLILGTMSGWPPFVTIDDNADYQGLDIDIACEIAKKLNKKLVIKDMDTAMLITSLSQGRVDFIMTGLSITKDRQKKITMVPYQGEAIKELTLIFWDKIPDGISSLDDLKKIPNAIICVEPGSSQEEFIKKQNLEHSGVTIKESNPSESLLNLKYGKAIACVLEPTIFSDFKTRHPNLKSISIALDEENQIMGNGIGIRKDNKELTTKIESIIKKLKANGFIALCEKKWLGKES
jgi:ABC-type amino acid transport substrate-binding protein